MGIRCSLIVPNTIVGGNTGMRCTVVTRGMIINRSTMVNNSPRIMNTSG